MKDKKEIEKMLDNAVDESDSPSRNRKGMSYEDGVRYALEWVLGQVEDDEHPFA